MGKKLSVIGGDMRQLKMAEEFIKDGFNVYVYGFDRDVSAITISETLHETISGSKKIILGINPCDEKMNIATPYWKDILSVSNFLSHLSPDTVIIGGKLSDAFKNLAAEKNIKCIDYVNREDFAVLNAVPTVEGAIEIAMNELPFTLHGSNCLVSGFGRIGKLLARQLMFLGANVTCSARKSGDLAWIKSLGYTPVDTSNLISSAHEYDVIFNTIPVEVFSREILRNIRPGTLIIDLASKPGGVDISHAEKLGIKVVWALSLPGKVAPDSAGKIIKDTVANILKEL